MYPPGFQRFSKLLSSSSQVLKGQNQKPSSFLGPSFVLGTWSLGPTNHEDLLMLKPRAWHSLHGWRQLRGEVP